MKALILLFIGLAIVAGCSSSRVPAKSPPFLDLTSPPEPFIYVDGEFRFPGRHDWTNGMTLHDAINSAGGFTEFSNHKIRVFHRDGSQNFYRVDHGFSYRTEHGYRLTNNPPVQVGDRIVIPRSNF
jgi:protein involved in polysaccharide export with SLBB domain